MRPMTNITLSTPALNERRRLAGLAAVFIAIACAGLPYVVLGSLTLYPVVYPATMGALAVALYSISRPVYIEFSMWVWFLTPFIRRLVDYGNGAFTEDSLVLTAPLVVGGVGILGLWTLLTEEAHGVRQAFILMLVALAYGGAVGLVVNGPVKMGLDGLQWGIPLVTGALILVDWRQYPRYRAALLRTITLGMGVLGLYGIYQFFVLPPWDRMWMESAPMQSLGNPVPMQVRVFGMLNAPNPFAMTMAVGLLGLLAAGVQSRTEALLAKLAAIPAGAALLLCQVRTGWGAYVVGLLYVMFMARRLNRWRVIVFLLLMVAALTPLVLMEGVSGVLSERTSTLTDLENDNSFNDRMNMYSTALPAVSTNPFGWGLGLPGSIDSGIIQLLAKLGWVGSALFMLGFAMLFLWVWRTRHYIPAHDPFVPVAVGIAVAMTATLPFQNFFMEVQGVYLWGFLAIAIAGSRYHRAVAAFPAPEAAGAAEPPPRRAPAPV